MNIVSILFIIVVVAVLNLISAGISRDEKEFMFYMWIFIISIISFLTIRTNKIFNLDLEIDLDDIGKEEDDKKIEIIDTTPTKTSLYAECSSLWVHIKTGRIYNVCGTAYDATANGLDPDRLANPDSYSKSVVYTSCKNGMVYTREVEDFRSKFKLLTGHDDLTYKSINVGQFTDIERRGNKPKHSWTHKDTGRVVILHGTALSQDINDSVAIYSDVKSIECMCVEWSIFKDKYTFNNV